jgi:zinc protease
MRVSIGLLALFASLGLLSDLKAEEPRVKHITTIEGISEFQLENGLKVLLFPDLSSSKVTVNLTVFVGSRHEGY